jgi:hypothetical protein
MVLITCDSVCSIARLCRTHKINRPDPKVRLQEVRKHKPRLKEKCPGFEELR